jgi:hypothetical protein
MKTPLWLLQRAASDDDHFAGGVTGILVVIAVDIA